MTEKIVLTREMLLEQRDELKIEKVELSRGFVFVREMTAAEKNIWERSMMRRIDIPGQKQTSYEPTFEDYQAKLACVTVCDEHGNLLFTMRDVKKLSSMISASNLQIIINKSQELNAISEQDREEILGNLEQGLQDNSTSDSAEN